MTKIIIKNFRAIDYAEIEIKPFTVIIGEQASGKSTISKLVYFFRYMIFQQIITIDRYFLEKIIQNSEYKFDELDYETLKKDIEDKFKNDLKIKFFHIFNSTMNEDFEIGYIDDKFSFTSIITSDSKVSISVNFLNEVFDKEVLKTSYSNNKERVFNLHNFKDDKIRPSWNNITRDNVIKIFFIPASRSLITSILPASQNKFIAEINKRTNDNQIDYFVKIFLDDIDFFKRNYFFGKSLDEVIDEFELKTGKENLQAKQLRDKIKVILKADYQHGNSGEQLVHKRFLKPISLDKASSGQQEVVWILLTLLALILEDHKSFVVIEEPEAHLYPKTQAKVVEYIAQFFNAKEGNEMILTTHSPYILTVLNNLLFAKQISVKTHGVENQVIAESVDPKAWLDIENFSAYYVGYNNEGQFIKSIINPETGLISVNALDDASDDIMDTFDDLMDIYKGATV